MSSEVQEMTSAEEEFRLKQLQFLVQWVDGEIETGRRVTCHASRSRRQCWRYRGGNVAIEGSP